MGNSGLGVLTRRTNLAGWPVGVAVSIPSQVWIQNFTQVHWVYYAPSGIVITMIVSYAASVVIGWRWRIPLAEAEYTMWGRRLSFSAPDDDLPQPMTGADTPDEAGQQEGQ